MVNCSWLDISTLSKTQSFLEGSAPITIKEIDERFNAGHDEC